MLQHAFHVCRKCLKLESSGELEPMFDEPGRFKIFETIADVMFTEERGDTAVLVCKSCIEDVYEAFEFRQSFWQAEVVYFQLKRKAYFEARTAADHNNTLSSFNVCRSCLSPHSYLSVTQSAFDFKSRNGVELIKMLSKITNLNMAADRGKFNVRLCVGCIFELEKCFKVRMAMRNAERSHFGPCRVLSKKVLHIEPSDPEEAQIDSIQGPIPEASNRPITSDQRTIEYMEISIGYNVDPDNGTIHSYPDNYDSNKENEALLQCNVEGCSRTFKSKSGLSRHTNVAHIFNRHRFTSKRKSFLRQQPKKVYKNI